MAFEGLPRSIISRFKGNVVEQCLPDVSGSNTEVPSPEATGTIRVRILGSVNPMTGEVYEHEKPFHNTFREYPQAPLQSVGEINILNT